MFSGDFCKLTKTPSDGTSLGEPPGNFSDVGCCCCCFTSLEVFTFPGYFSLPQALHPGFLGQWGSPPALSSTLATFGFFTFAKIFRHSFTASVTVLSWCFLPTGAFYLTLLPRILGRFCDSDAGRNTPSRILLCACPHGVVPFGWCMDLNYSYCSYKDYWFINCTKEPQSIKLKFNYWTCCACSKSYGKTVKTLWTRLDKRYCLKLLRQNSTSKLFWKSSHP